MGQQVGQGRYCQPPIARGACRGDVETAEGSQVPVETEFKVRIRHVTYSRAGSRA